MKLSILIVFTSFSLLGFSQSFRKKLSFSMGINNTSITLQGSTLKTNQNAPASSIDNSDPEASSVIISSVEYDLYNDVDKSYVISTILPLIGEDTSYFQVGVGLRYFFKSLSSTLNYEKEGSSLQMKSKLKYFAGANLSTGYLVYKTAFSKKNDIIFSLEGEGGLYYDITDKYALRGSFVLSKGFGVETSTFATRLLLGLTIYMEELF